MYIRLSGYSNMILFIKGWDTDRETLEVAFLMAKIFTGFDILTSLGLLIASCLLIYGIKKEKDRFLLPAIYYIPIDGALR